MSKKLSEQHLRTEIGIVIFVVLLCIIGVTMKVKLEQLTRNYEMQQMTKQVSIQAKLIDEQMKVELDKLESLATFVEANNMDWEAIVGAIGANEEFPDIKYGILELDGKAVYGEVLSVKEFSGIQDSFHGNQAVCYSEHSGMVFSVPIYNGVNVRYVMYKCVPENILNEFFDLENFEGQGCSAVVLHSGQLIFEDAMNGLSGIWEDEDIQTAYSRVLEEMSVVTAATVPTQIEETASFFYASEIGQTEFLLVGTVPKKVVAQGIGSIGTLILWVFGLLMILFIIGVLYLIGEEAKVRESEALREAKIVAENANKAKSDFLANMSHEIRTPINAIMGMNEMVLRESKDQEIIPYAQDIQSASQNLLSIINDILDFSKIEAGKMEIVDGKYDLCSLLNNVTNMISVKAEQKMLAFETNVDNKLPAYMYGDPVRIQQILVNLLNNAVKYTEKGSVSMEMTEARKDETSTVLHIEIKDTGIGIKEEDISKLFHGFQRVDLERNRSVEGTGLGLAITARLAEQMGGSIQVKSVYGLGSVFTVDIPQQIIDATPIGDFKERYEAFRKSRNHYHEMFVAPKAKVLVVDDNAMNLQVARNFLKQTKVQVKLCSSGAECLEIVQNEHYDVILLDHMMPGMDGIETLKRIKSLSDNKCLNTPIIALTANAIVGVREMYLAEGFDDYLSKPIEGRLLESMLLEYLPEELIEYSEMSEAAEAKEEQKAETVPISPVGAEMEDGEETQQDLYAVDQEAGLMYAANSEEMYQMLLQMYVEENIQHTEELKDYYEAKDWKNYAIIAHAVKSTSKTIGALNFSEAAKYQEFAGKEERVEDIEATFEEFIEQYRTMAERVKELYNI